MRINPAGEATGILASVGVEKIVGVAAVGLEVSVGD